MHFCHFEEIQRIQLPAGAGAMANNFFVRNQCRCGEEYCELVNGEKRISLRHAPDFPERMTGWEVLRHEERGILSEMAELQKAIERIGEVYNDFY